MVGLSFKFHSFIPLANIIHDINKQPLRLEVKKELTARSERVKSVDISPSEVSPSYISSLNYSKSLL